MRILVSGGGTAGHITPILATVDALKSRDKQAEILYVGGHSGMEAGIATAAGIEFASIQAGKYRRAAGSSWLARLADWQTNLLNLRDVFLVIAGLVQSIQIVRRWRPDAIFIKGGYVGLPVGLAAALLRVPFMIHESDVQPGLTNKILARWARLIAVGWPVKFYRSWDKAKLVFTGNPVRPEVLRGKPEQAKMRFSLEKNLPVVLVTGGSQGAQPINDAVLDSLRDLLSFCQVIHLTGRSEFDRVSVEVKAQSLPNLNRYHAEAFLDQDLSLAYAAADVVISRAGATTIAELAAWRKPVILIPNELMAAHQIYNARLLSRLGAVLWLPESQLSAQTLVANVKKLLGSEGERASLQKAISQLGNGQAASQLAELILQLGPNG